MKKLWILFTALALLAVAMPAVADVTTGAVFYWYGTTDFDTGDASVLKARIKVAGTVDEFNKISTEIRWSGNGDWNPANARVKTFKLDTDITGALKLDLPVTVKATAGVWESDFTGWWYATRAGWSFVGGLNDQQQPLGAAQLDIGAGPVNLHYYQNMKGMLQGGLDAAFGPVAVWLAFQGDGNALADGKLAFEAKYEGKFGDIGLNAYPAVLYNLGASTLGWDFGVSSTIKMLTVAASVGGTDPDYFDKIEAELGASFGDAALWAAMYMSLAAANAFQGVDLMASYKFGGATAYLGYVISPDGAEVPVDGGEWNSTGGLYVGLKASF